MIDSIDKISPKLLSQIKAVLFDIDDTFSTHGKIQAEAFTALWKLKQAGFITVPVTGRPAGWCDFIARMWPVDAVVGENGAFYAMMRQGKLVKKYLEPLKVREYNAQRLKKLQRAIIKAFPGASFASDQAFREFDLAIDYCEDVRPWSDAKVRQLMDFCERAGAQAKLSSIHVNTWFGRYDKWSCVDRVIKDVVGLDTKVRRAKINSANFSKQKEFGDLQRVVYLGDSPNDEPFFERLPLTIGVANVGKFLPKMKHPPRYITSKEGGGGFSEFAEMLLAAR